MIEATCGACGTLNRVADSDVAVGARFVTCSSCKARVPIPTKTLHGAPSIPPIPPAPLPKVPIPITKSEVIDLADLPAPKRAVQLGAEPSRPAPRSGLSAAGDADLLTPKVFAEPEPAMMDLDDLMGPPEDAPPEPRRDLADLPAPKHAVAPPMPKQRVVGDLPTPKRSGSEPASRAPVRGEVDLPAPKHSANVMDLPAPRGFSDLPMPKPGFADLPTPKPGGVTDLPTPKYGTVDSPARFGNVDLPTPKHDSPGLLTPVNPELPAPKGFFDDLPQPARSGTGLPAPKGFFDDLPQVAKDRPDVPAPKGFFDDLPQRAKNRPDVPAPKGFFDDLPQKAKNRPEVPAPKGFFDDLPQPHRSQRESQGQNIDLGDLEPPGGDIDLGLPEPNARASHDKIDLEGPLVRIQTGNGASQTGNGAGQARALQLPPDVPAATISSRSNDLALELEDTPRPSPARPAVAKRKVPKAAAVSKPQSRRKLLVVTLALLVFGGGGFFLYQRHARSVERANAIDDALKLARDSLVSPAAGHWRKAQAAAQQVLADDPENRDALSLGAEAHLAGALDTGLDGSIDAGKRLLNGATSAGASPAQLARPQGLAGIASNQAEHAIEKLKPLAAAAPKDGFLALYLGWAQAASNDLAGAIKSFDVAVAAGPATKISGLYARGRAKLAAGDLDAARADFTAIYDVQKDHIGAQVGIAAAAPASHAAQRETDLLAILARKDIKTADPRAIAQAWTLAADEARRAGRLDSARERYRKALAAVDKDVAATTGLAEVELRDNKVDAAADLATKATTQSPSYVPAQLVMGEIEIRQRRLDEATKLLDALDKRTPPLSQPEKARWKLVDGKLLEAQDQADAAVEAFVEAAKLAGEADLAPRMAAVTTLMAMSHKAALARDPHRASMLATRADSILGNLPELAKSDPTVAMTLGVAYLEADNAARAEPWLRHATVARPDDLSALFQLAKALSRLGRVDEAISQLRKAADKDPGRSDIALELARTYEAAGRDSDADTLYDKLLHGKDISIEARGWAGRFYVRKGKLALGAEQGEEIRQVDSSNAAGLYLRGEGQLAQGSVEPAAKAFKRATELDPDPVYFDAWGRAAEAQAIQTKDTRFEDVAIRAYQSAHDGSPTMLNPLAGLGRIYLGRRDPSRAVPPLLEASKLKPDDPDIAYDIGAAYQDLQQNPTAIKWLELSGREKQRAETFWRLGQLYYDGSHDKDAAKNLALATRYGNQEEKDTGKTIEWLTEALYQYGTIELALHNAALAREAYVEYVARSPKNAAQLKEVRYKLATELRR